MLRFEYIKGKSMLKDYTHDNNGTMRVACVQTV